MTRFLDLLLTLGLLARDTGGLGREKDVCSTVPLLLEDTDSSSERPAAVNFALDLLLTLGLLPRGGADGLSDTLCLDPLLLPYREVDQESLDSLKGEVLRGSLIDTDLGPSKASADSSALKLSLASVCDRS